MRAFILLLGMVTGSSAVFSQVITFSYEENFEWQVKQIDEFIDRFNNADYTPLRQFLEKEYQLQDIRRTDLLKTLFNLEKEWAEEKVLRFLADVTQAQQPPYLDFYDKNWYARLNCQGIYQGEPVTFDLVLSVQLNAEAGSSKWVINSLAADFLPQHAPSALAFSVDMPKAGSNTLNPASFGTDFMNLAEALSDTASLQNYINQETADRSLLTFMDLLYRRKLLFRQVNCISYHFLQVPGWVFEVEDFSRLSKNSGWLISKLLPLSEKDKIQYRSTELFLGPAKP